ncbi:dTDP-4-dehydrorhamnose reductase [Chloroflexota bacterium]
MKILIIGKNGQLGWELNQLLRSKTDLVALDFPDIDLNDPDNLCHNIEQIKPAIIINAGAYTAVDEAEIENKKAFSINGRGPGILAELARSLDAVLIHYSTDYVFDGLDGPYVETDLPSPINEYGKSKLKGENEICSVDGTYLILRTSWVYNMKSDNFVTRVMKWAREKETMKIVDDQISNPTFARELAIGTDSLISLAGKDYRSWFNDNKGLYHLAGNGFISRFGWVKKIIELDPDKDKHLVSNLIPVSSTSFPTPAKRPLFSALDCQKFFATFGFQLPKWEQSLNWALRSSKISDYIEH